MCDIKSTEKGTPQKKEQRRTNHEKYVSTFELYLSFKLKDIRNCHHISYVTSKSVWVNNNKTNLILTNVYGEAEKILKMSIVDITLVMDYTQ